MIRVRGCLDRTDRACSDQAGPDIKYLAIAYSQNGRNLPCPLFHSLRYRAPDTQRPSGGHRSPEGRRARRPEASRPTPPPPGPIAGESRPNFEYATSLGRAKSRSNQRGCGGSVNLSPLNSSVILSPRRRTAKGYVECASECPWGSQDQSTPLHRFKRGTDTRRDLLVRHNSSGPGAPNGVAPGPGRTFSLSC